MRKDFLQSPQFSLGLTLGFFLLNLIVKGIGIGAEGYYLDEAVQIHAGQSSFLELIQWAGWDPTPPLYYILSSFWNKIFGISEIATRFLSLIFSSVTAGMIFWLGKKHLNMLAGGLGAAWFCVSQFNLEYAQEARAYAFFSFLVVLSIHFLWNYLKEPKISKLLPLLGVNLLLTYTHSMVLFAFLIQGMMVLSQIRTKPKVVFSYVGGMILAVSTFIPWLLYKRSQGGFEYGSWIGSPDWEAMTYCLEMLFDSIWIFYGVMSVGLAVLAYFFIRRKANKPNGENAEEYKPDLQKFLFLAIWVLVPLLGAYVFSQHVISVFLPKYLLFISPGFFLFAGYTLSVLPIPKRILLGAGLVLLGIQLFMLDYSPPKVENMKEAVKQIKEIQKPGEAILITTDYQMAPFAYYYDNEAFKDHKNTFKRLKKNHIYLGREIDYMEMWQLYKYDQVIHIKTNMESQDPKGLQNSWLKKHFCIESNYDYANIKLREFKKAPCSGPQSQEFLVDFENIPSPIKGVAFVNEKAGYSKGFEEIASDINAGKFGDVTIHFKAKKLRGEGNVKLVFTIFDGKEPYYWAGFDLNSFLTDTSWTIIEVEPAIQSPKNPTDKVSCYLWNPDNSETEVWMDDLKLTFY